MVRLRIIVAVSVEYPAECMTVVAECSGAVGDCRSAQIACRRPLSAGHVDIGKQYNLLVIVEPWFEWLPELTAAASP